MNLTNSYFNETKQPCISYSITFLEKTGYSYNKNQPSIYAQKKLMREIAYMKNMTVLDEYLDEDVPAGIPVESLPGFQKTLMHFETTNYPNVILMVDDISRVSRNNYRQYLLIKRATAICFCRSIYSGTYFFEEHGLYKPDFLTKASKLHEVIPSEMMLQIVSPDWANSLKRKSNNSQ